MGNRGQIFCRKCLFAREMYLWGWRWVVFVIWGLPYGVAALYDFMQGQGFLPKDWLLLSQILPYWLPGVWLIVGLVAIIIVTFEGAYRISRKDLQVEKADYSLVLGSYEWFINIGGGKQNYWEDEDGGTDLLLDGYIAVNTFRRILIESVELNIGGQVFKSDWESDEYIGFDEPSIQFKIPLNTQRGKRTTHIQATVNGTPFVGESFTLDLPRGKRVFHT